MDASPLTSRLSASARALLGFLLPSMASEVLSSGVCRASLDRGQSRLEGIRGQLCLNPVTHSPQCPWSILSKTRS